MFSTPILRVPIEDGQLEHEPFIKRGNVNDNEILYAILHMDYRLLVEATLKFSFKASLKFFYPHLTLSPRNPPPHNTATSLILFPQHTYLSPRSVISHIFQPHHLSLGASTSQCHHQRTHTQYPLRLLEQWACKQVSNKVQERNAGT